MIVAGIGFRQGARVEDLARALDMVEAIGGKAGALATLPGKAAAPALLALADQRGLKVLSVAVAGIPTPTQSVRIMAMHGCGSVAEAAAIAGAGAGARITVTRLSAPGGMATAAMAATKGAAE